MFLHGRISMFQFSYPNKPIGTRYKYIKYLLQYGFVYYICISQLLALYVHLQYNTTKNIKKTAIALKVNYFALSFEFETAVP